MTHGIRPVEREDLPHVASLYELVMRSGTPTAAPGLMPYFERTVFDHPWVDREIPSLVYAEPDGAITGFIASHVRRFRFQGAPVRLACGGQLVAHPAARHKAVGALLMHRYLAGPQDVTITDTASVATHAMWARLRGEEVALGCIGWTRVFRPLRFAADRKLPDRGRRLTRPIWSALELRSRRSPRRHAAPAGAVAEELTPRGLRDAVEATDLAFRPAYDEPFLEWLFSELARVRTYGRLVKTLLRDADGVPFGWYVYYLRPEGTSHVLQVMAREGFVGATLDHLLAHARWAGAAAVRGRLEPRLLEPLARRRSILRYEGGSLVHSRDAGILNSIAYGDALLTRMDGEWWMGHHVERLDDAESAASAETDRPSGVRAVV